MKTADYTDALVEQLALGDFVFSRAGKTLLNELLPEEGLEGCVTPFTYAAMLHLALARNSPFYAPPRTCRAIAAFGRAMPDWTLKEGALPDYHGFLWLGEPLALPVPPGYVVEELFCTGLIWNRYDQIEREAGTPPGVVPPGETPAGAERRQRYLFSWVVSMPDRPAGVPLLLTAWPLGRSFMESVNDARDDARAEGLERSLVPLVDPALRNLAALMSMLERGILRCRTKTLRGSALDRCFDEALRVEEEGRQAEVLELVLRD